MNRIVTVLLVVSVAALCCGGEEGDSSPKLPEGMAGFSGSLKGTVVAVKDTTFTLKVDEVVRLWKGNKAKDPKSAIGKELEIQGKNKWHMKFIATLKKDEKLTIEAIDREGKLYVLELNGEQRKRAGVGG